MTNGKYLPHNKEKLKLVPKKPGVYIMKNEDGRVIYVGKAKALKNRLSQYFIGTPNNYKTMRMVLNVKDFDYIITRSESDALILENNLIKKYKPKYNILLKDDKTYPFIKVNLDVRFPYLSLVRKTKKDANKYYGPFINGRDVNEIIDMVSKAYKLRKCSYDLKNANKRECLDYHINACTAPCSGKISDEAYNENVQLAIKALDNHLKPLVPVLTEKMERYSENLDFENAAKMRDSLKLIEKFSQRHVVVTVKKLDIDVIGFFRDGDISGVSVLSVRKGIINNKNSYTFLNSSEISDEELVNSFTEQFYMTKDDSVKRIVAGINTDYVPDYEGLSQAVSDIFKKEIKITAARGTFSKNLLSLAQENAAEAIKLRLNTKIDDVLFMLKEELKLKKTPIRIESYDMSNTAGSNAVGVMTVFENGVLTNKEKRSFIIKGQNGSDDYASMHEVLMRRFENLKNTEDGFSVPPDLILVDGGKGQVNAARQAMDFYGFDFPVFGMVKNQKHRMRDLTNGSIEMNLRRNHDVFVFVSKINEATHKNAVGFHTKRNTLTASKSQLTEIKGVGKTSMLKLYREFKTITAIKNASIEELRKAVTKPTAENIYKYFHEE